MAETTGIEWCHHTKSPWYGCTKVSPGCANCYAAEGSKRSPASLGIWGPRGKRRVLAEASWHRFKVWDRDARDAGERRRVFPSWCDPFEDWDGPMVDSNGDRLWVVPGGRWFPGPDGADWNHDANGTRPVTMDDVRARFFRTILATPHLDYLLLTKRPENILRLWPVGHEFTGPGPIEWPNLWLGVSVEDQASVDARLPHLRRIPATIKFVSYEPALAAVDFTRVRCPNKCKPPHYCNQCHPDGGTANGTWDALDNCEIDWVIAGGESGTGARPMDPAWARSVRDQCKAAGTPFLFKQWGDWIGADQLSANGNMVGGITHHAWPDGGFSLKFPKKYSGRYLDGFIHDGYPTTEASLR